MLIEDLAKQARNPAQLAILLALIVGIAFESKIPVPYSEFADSSLGRLGLLAVFFALEYAYHWTIGILWVIFALLLVTPTASRLEGFVGGGGAKRKRDRIHVKEAFDGVSVIERPERWFVERVLKENPAVIKEREVNTYPVQD